MSGMDRMFEWFAHATLFGVAMFTFSQWTVVI
jgi:hypothetical protein